MEKLTLVSLFVTLSFLQWQSIYVESKDTVKAKVISVINQDNDKSIVLVKDDEAKSGWAFKVKHEINEKITEDYWVLFFSRTDPKEEFYYSFGGSLWFMLNAKQNKHNWLPIQIMDMIFPTQGRILKVGTAAIHDTAQVDPSDVVTTSGVVLENMEFPEKTPYEMEVRLYHITRGEADYAFKIYLNIGGDINKK